MIITFDDRKRVEAMLALIRELAGDLKVLVRTRDDSFLEQYKQAGAFEVIPESQEGALMLVSHLLLNCDIPIGRVIRRMELERSSQYRFLHGFYWGIRVPAIWRQISCLNASIRYCCTIRRGRWAMKCASCRLMRCGSRRCSAAIRVWSPDPSWCWRLGIG